jgi:ABC-type Mn2+/Zn2+ transport system permease subunit
MLAKLKCAYKSKTVWFAIIIGTLSVLQGFVFYLPIDPRWQAFIGVIVAVICILLRFVTNKPLNDL